MLSVLETSVWGAILGRACGAYFNYIRSATHDAHVPRIGWPIFARAARQPTAPLPDDVGGALASGA